MALSMGASRLWQVIAATFLSLTISYIIISGFELPSFIDALPFSGKSYDTTSEDPSRVGRWGPSIPLPLVPVAVAVLPQSGKILAWSADTPSVFTNATTHTLTAIYDPRTGAIASQNVTSTRHNMFCPGLSLDATGRPVITGGSSPNSTSIYDPVREAWIAGPELNTGRGYHSQATLSDGRIFVIGGSWSGGVGKKDGEVLLLTDPSSYPPNNPSSLSSPQNNRNEKENQNEDQWTNLPNAPALPLYTNDTLGPFAADNHAWLFAWRNSSVFQAGPSREMNWYSVSERGQHASAGRRGRDGHDAMNGNAVMFDAVAGKILTLGGAESYSGCAASRAAHVITLSTVFSGSGGDGDVVVDEVFQPPSKVKVEEILPPMRYARAYANSVVLPTGDVLVTGGASYAKQWTDDNATLVPEMWSAETGRFAEMARMPVARTYHSVAVLLPDGTVLTGGGGLCWDTCRGREKEINHMDLQVFRPPYLFKRRGGGEAERPRILEVSNTRVRPGGRLEVGTSGVVKEFALLRYASATHAINTDQRRIRLDGLPLGDGETVGEGQPGRRYEMRVPDDAGIAVPGYWMLFAISREGVPSLAETILVQT